jgi:hypothetical protein
MSVWFKENKEYENTYCSLNALQNKAYEKRKLYQITEPKIYDMLKCFICKKDFEMDDVIDFYSDMYNEYCQHHEKCSYTVYKFEKKNLVITDLQNIINATCDIDFSHDNIIPPYIKKLNLIQRYRDYNLDFSQSRIVDLCANNYDKLKSYNFMSVNKLECYRTPVDFTKFINLTNLQLSRILENTILSSCINLVDVTLNNIDYDIDLSNCYNLITLKLSTINKNINLKGCSKLETLEMKNVNVLIDVSDCVNLALLRLEDMKLDNVPKNINSLTNLHIINIYDFIDVAYYPNIKVLTNNIYMCNNGNYGKHVLNYDKLQNLELFKFSDVRFINNVSIEYNFNFTNNTKLKTVDIYSAINNCNVVFGENLELIECNLEFYSNNQIIVPKNITKSKYKRELKIIKQT